jgi:hypothetical protein
MLYSVLWKNKNPLQIWGASIGVFVGLLLLLFALQIYFDIQTLIKGARDNNILVLNKKVDSPAEKGFSPVEIQDLRKQSFFKDVETFESNRYEVWADMKRMGFSTLLFFQSVSNRFLELDTTKFVWKNEGDVLPIIMSSDYLALYNFGFSSGQGLPKLSADIISTIQFDIEIGNKEKKKRFKAYVYGFTQNINSILVPKSFMEYANSTFGSKSAKEPTQVVLSTDNPYNRNLEKYLSDHELEISRGGLIGGELKTALYLMISLVLLIASIIIGLSLLVFILNFQLLIAQSSWDIKLLLDVGFPYQKITNILSKRLIFLFLIISTLVFSVLFPVKYLLTQGFITQGYDKLSLWLNPIVIIFGIIFCLLFVWINHLVIKNNVKKLA